MLALKVLITKYLDSSQPGWVQCEFKDVYNKNWIVEEKLPVLSTLDLNEESEYPQLGFIACRIIERKTEKNIDLAVIDIEYPWDIESTSGQQVFTVTVQQLCGLKD